MYQSISSLSECITFYLQDEISLVLLHPHLNIVFWATKHGLVRVYDFQKEVRNYYQSRTCGIWKYVSINDNLIEELKIILFTKLTFVVRSDELDPSDGLNFLLNNLLLAFSSK